MQVTTNAVGSVTGWRFQLSLNLLLEPGARRLLKNKTSASFWGHSELYG